VKNNPVNLVDPAREAGADRTLELAAWVRRSQSRMPLGFDGADANLYRYVSNNPTRTGDPLGLDEKDKTADPALLLKLAAQDPTLKQLLDKLTDAQKKELYDTLANPGLDKGPVLNSILMNTILRTKEYGKEWLLVGPSDAENPLNVGKEKRVMSYNCAGRVLMRFGKTILEFDGQKYEIITLGSGAWPDGLKEYDEFERYNDLLKNVWDPFFVKVGDKGFHRLDWKPDLSSVQAVKDSKLPEFKKGKNYIILMADLLPAKGKITQVQFLHVFTNLDSNLDWWVSKLGAGGTIAHRSPTLLQGSRQEGGQGYIVAIWEQND
jgi:hypothetical protein